MSLVKRNLVPVGTVDCAYMEMNGSTQRLIVTVTVVIYEQSYLITVGVVEGLPVDAVLGWDLPILLDLLLETEEAEGIDSGESGDVCMNVVCPVVTRAQAKADVQPLPDLDSSLREGGTKGPRKSRRQRCFEKQLKLPDPEKGKASFNSMLEVPDNISVLKRGDGTLKPLFAKVFEGPVEKCLGRERFVIDNNVLYAANEEHKRLVVPADCRSLVIHLAHTFLWAGHLGRHKTYIRVSAHFYWPSMYTDIQKYCSTCPTCQKTCIAQRSDRAFLHSLPIVSTPFRRIAMDIVGPLVKSSGGHQYILVVCDYATRFPEAFLLQTITAPAVMRAPVQLSSRVGVPDEILTDQGTNFTARLMQLFHKQLGITTIKTTSYHPQTDGLMERLNQTLKRMLKMFVNDTGKDRSSCCTGGTSRALWTY